MANDRNSMEEQHTGPERDRSSNVDEESVRSGSQDDVRGIVNEEDDEFEDADDLEEDEDSDGSF